ncbi:pleckstrin homology domain-containing family A member 4 isoform X3 [Gadus chalcogrammus]|uniref:pleckstrin homology domain-containing family A member 4 isoform X3 n=1 Tax=Gadus chalcogrammus TaxID=1042646 RepID=UPI0024C4B689|nr:pleckstrin homology domain-containing family A member 4 isoform X3 [Gadus chalcogrammus]
MDDQDRVSQASSMATVSSLPVHKSGGGEKLQSFGKRYRSARRDPNCPVVIRGWLNKKDSAGLKLWKRRWFVLSNYCLFYYKDSREECVLGSIPLPSYNILFCSTRECKNRKYTFKVVHQGMRSYYFSADTQEDMLGWVRALGQAAAMEQEGTLNRRCCSYQDFSQLGGSSESVASPSSEGECFLQKPRYVSRTLSEPSHLTGARGPHPHAEQRARRPSPSPSRDRCGLEDSASCGGSLTPRGQLGSRPHTPVGRVDIRPQNDPFVTPQPLFYTPPSPKHQFRPHPPTPVLERWLNKPVATYGSVHHGSTGRRTLAKSHSTGGFPEALPPLPRTTRLGHVPHPTHHHHHHHHGNHVSVCVVPTTTAVKPEMRDTPPLRPLETDADAVLTRLCGCDKLLQALSMELAQLQVDKISVAVLQDSVQVAMEMGRMQVAVETSRMPLEEWRTQDAALSQKALLQDELVTIRARMCDVSLEMERVWAQYERMESELSIIRSHLQHITDFGSPQHQSQAQRDLWMMEDVLSALKPNRDHHSALLRLHTLVPPAVRDHHTHSTSPPSPSQTLQSTAHMELQEANQMRAPQYDWTDPSYERIDGRGDGRSQAGPMGGWRQTPDPTITSHKGARMGEEEQMRTKEKPASRKKPPIMPCGPRRSRSSEPRDETPFPLRVTRVVTATLPSSLVARRVAVDDPPPELSPPLPEQIPDPRPSPRPPSGLDYVPARHRVVSWESPPRQTEDGARDGGPTADTLAQGPPSRPLNPGQTHDLALTPEQREAKLRRVQRIRERVVRSAVRESSTTPVHLSDKEVPLLTDDRKLAGQTPGVRCHSDGSAERRGGAAEEKEAEPRSRLPPPAGRGTNGSVKHSSSVTWYQREDGRQVSPDRRRGDDRSQSSRAQWFLSTNQWQGFIPLQSQGAEPLCDQEVADITGRPEKPEEPVSDAGDATSSSSSSSSSSHVSHLSLEKMKENHALFYQIACDVSISDTDVTPGDHNGNDVNDRSDQNVRSDRNNNNDAESSEEPPGEGVPVSEGQSGTTRRAWDALFHGISLPAPSDWFSSSPSLSKQGGDPEELRIQEELEALAPEVLPEVSCSSSSSSTSSSSTSSSSSQQDVLHHLKGEGRGDGAEKGKEEEAPRLGDEPGGVTKASEEVVILEEVKREQEAVKRDQDEGKKGQEGRKRNQEQTRVFRKSSSLSDSREAIPGDSGFGDVTTVLRGAGFGNTRVTVLRTSL